MLSSNAFDALKHIEKREGLMCTRKPIYWNEIKRYVTLMFSETFFWPRFTAMWYYPEHDSNQTENVENAF